MMLFFHQFGGLGWATVAVWMVLDLVMFVQYFIYARPRQRRTLMEQLFWARSIALVIIGAGTPLVLTFHFEDYHGLIAAYFQNALMSVLFCAMILERNSLAGQSLYIALCKFVGTSMTLVYGEPSNALLQWCYFLIMTFDLAYIGLILRVAKRDGVRVWQRL